MGSRRRVYPEADLSQGMAHLDIQAGQQVPQQPQMVPMAPAAQYQAYQAPVQQQQQQQPQAQAPYFQQQQQQPPQAPAPYFQQQQQQQPQAQVPYFQQQQPTQQEYGLSQLARDLPIEYNQLYSTDLLRDLPPPIKDLSFPPPPISLPLNNPDLMASTEYMRSSLNVVPKTSSVFKKSKLPFNLVVRPYIKLTDAEESFPLAPDTSIIRCRRCRAYLNPFVELKNGNTKWRCNMCMLLNDAPNIGDITQRGEMNSLHYEFRAPSEYAARPPEALSYVFILDVSQSAIQSGLLQVSIETILDSIDSLPNPQGRACVSFIGVDSQLYYFGVPEDSQGNEISMMVVGPKSNISQPAPNGLLINVKNCRNNLEKLLTQLPGFFNNNVNPSFDLANGLKAGYKLVEHLGGKLTVIAATLPNIGDGKLVSRDETKENKVLQPNNSFYRSFAVDCNRNQVSVDMFLASSSFMDVATLSQLPKFSSGQTHYYPAWSASSIEHIVKLQKEMSNYLRTEIGLEAVLRVRASDAISTKTYYGNFFSRASDLLAFPTFPRDQSFIVEMAVEEDIKRPVVYFQAAVLHTSVHGDRRVRVLNMALPTSDMLQQVYASADQLAMGALLARKAADKATTTLESAREFLDKSLIDMLAVYKKEIIPGNVGGASPLQFCTNLRMLPLICHSLKKNMAFRPKVPSDHRAMALNRLYTSPIDHFIQLVYPDVYSLHDMADDVGYEYQPQEGEEDEEDDYFPPRVPGEVILPEKINDTAMFLEKYGLYLIHNGVEILLYVGGDAVPELLNDVFGVQDILQVPIGKGELPKLDNDFNKKVNRIIETVRSQSGGIGYCLLYVVVGPSSTQEAALVQSRPETQGMRAWAAATMVEDRAVDQAAYKDQLGALRDKL